MGELGYQLVDTMDQLIPHLLYALNDLSEEQRYAYQDTNNPIAFSAWHLTRNLDEAIVGGVIGKPAIWEGRGYRAKLGIAADQRVAMLTHEQVLALKIEPWSDFLLYMRDVLSEIEGYLKNASDEELRTIIRDGRIDSEHPRADYSKARVIRGRLTHASMHSGEIYAIRGALGMKGSPI